MKTIAKALIITSLLTTSAHSGLFLDLDIGTPVHSNQMLGCPVEGTTITVKTNPDGTYQAYADCDGRYLGSDGPLGILRAGYQTKPKNMGPVNVSIQAYFQHISAIRESDGGLDFIAVGIRIE